MLICFIILLLYSQVDDVDWRTFGIDRVISHPEKAGKQVGSKQLNSVDKCKKFCNRNTHCKNLQFGKMAVDLMTFCVLYDGQLTGHEQTTHLVGFEQWFKAAATETQGMYHLW